MGESYEGKHVRKLAIPAVAESAMGQEVFFDGVEDKIRFPCYKNYGLYVGISSAQMGFKWNILRAKNKRKRNETESPLQMERGEIFHVS